MLLAEFLRPTQRPSLRPKPLRPEVEVSREAHFHTAIIRTYALSAAGQFQP